MEIAMKRIVKIAIICLAAFMTGCSTKYHVHVNGFLDTAHSREIVPNACILIVEDEENDNPIFHSEVKQKIQTLLKAKGFALCPPDSAEYQLLFGYGMDSGRTIQGTRMMHEPSQLVTIRRSNSKGGHSYSTIHVPGLTYSVPYSHTVFSHWLKLYLYDIPNAEETSAPPKPLWIGEITSSDPSSDLREIISPMLVGAFEHFGENTHKRIKEIIEQTDPRLKELERN
jgi:hypothetical protein